MPENSKGPVTKVTKPKKVKLVLVGCYKKKRGESNKRRMEKVRNKENP